MLQHAHQPVDWHPWNAPALAKAQEQDKPILLSVGYSACHWCHVMSHESFEDEGIAKIINAHFIPIKVDREERPDIDHVYMAAATAMTGQGGWPLTVFLTPQAEPFYAGTYFPPYPKWGAPGFLDVLHAVAGAWHKQRQEIVASARTMTERLQSMEARGHGPSAPLDEAVLEKAFRQMEGQFDAQDGGFGTAPKFPMAHQLSFLLRYHRRTDSAQALKMVETTLRAMARGGICDQVGGGFHRYSTDQYWRVPHFEKMLYDQALLARAYLEAFQVTGSKDFAQTARSIFDYVQRDMTGPQGAFYCAQDADSPLENGGPSKEGAFYVYTASSLDEVLGRKEAAVFKSCFGVLDQGNAAHDPHGELIDQNILYQARDFKQLAEEFSMAEEDIRSSLERSLRKVFEWRSRRPPPHVDDKCLCSWNGMMIASLAFGCRVLDEPKYAQAAAKASDFILSTMMKEGRLEHSWRGGSSGIPAQLEDYAFFIDGLLELYEAGFQDAYLNEAKRLGMAMIELFADPQGGFFMTAKDDEGLIVRPKDRYDGAMPSGNAAAALVLLKLHALTHEDIFLRQLEALLASLGPEMERSPYGHSFLLSVLDGHLQGPLEITFQGPANDPKLAAMIKILYAHYLPCKAIHFKPDAKPLRALVCRRGACQAPVEEAAQLEASLLRTL